MQADTATLAHMKPDTGYGAAMAAIAGLLAAAVFLVDTFTDIEGAIAVLYVLVLLLASEVIRRNGTIVLSGAVAGLAFFSFVYQHGIFADTQSILRLCVALAALFITTALLLRNHRARQDLIASYTLLRDSEVRYRSIFNESRVALWERDYSAVHARLTKLRHEGVEDFRSYVRVHPTIILECMSLIRTVAANQAALELVGQGSIDTMKDYVAADDETFLSLLDAVFSGFEHFEGEASLTSANGEQKKVLMTMSFPADVAGFDRIVVGMLDVTQRELAQKALMEAQAELTRASRAATVGALSATLAHELNQPLGAMVMNAQTLVRWLDKVPPDMQAVRRTAERLIRDSERAGEIIQNTKAMLAKGAGEVELVHMAELIDETRALMEHELQREAVSFEIHAQSPDPTVKAVRIELQQVLINLITNAIQAMSEANSMDRKLVVSMAKDQHAFRLSIRDNGPGIQEEAKEKIFAPFFTTKATGMGIGLAICRSTLEARGGELNAANHPDGGAVFEMIMQSDDGCGRP
jgi:signal transduction histidine kinase